MTFWAFAEPVGHGHVEGGALEERPLGHGLLDGDRGFLDALQARDGSHVQVLEGEGLAGDDLVGGAQRRLHHAAGDGEDVGRAGGHAQRRVHLLRRAGSRSRCRPA